MADKADTWMALYVNDYAGDTLHLNRAQHGSYLLMIMAAFKNAGWLPNDDGLLAQIAKCTAREWKAEKAVYAAFFQITAERWTHKRVTLEWEKAQRLTEQRRAAGAASAAKRQRPFNGRSTVVVTDDQREGQRNGRPPEEHKPSVTTSRTVGENARQRATLIDKDWQPKPETVEELRRGRPDLVGAFYDAELDEFRLWCRANAVTSHDPEASFLRFMRRANRVTKEAAESWDQRRIREGLEALDR